MYFLKPPSVEPPTPSRDLNLANPVRQGPRIQALSPGLTPNKNRAHNAWGPWKKLALVHGKNPTVATADDIDPASRSTCCFTILPGVLICKVRSCRIDNISSVTWNPSSAASLTHPFTQARFRPAQDTNAGLLSGRPLRSKAPLSTLWSCCSGNRNCASPLCPCGHGIQPPMACPILKGKQNSYL